MFGVPTAPAPGQPGNRRTYDRSIALFLPRIGMLPSAVKLLHSTSGEAIHMPAVDLRCTMAIATCARCDRCSGSGPSCPRLPSKLLNAGIRICTRWRFCVPSLYDRNCWWLCVIVRRLAVPSVFAVCCMLRPERLARRPGDVSGSVRAQWSYGFIVIFETESWALRKGLGRPAVHASFPRGSGTIWSAKFCSRPRRSATAAWIDGAAQY